MYRLHPCTGHALFLGKRQVQEPNVKVVSNLVDDLHGIK